MARMDWIIKSIDQIITSSSHKQIYQMHEKLAHLAEQGLVNSFLKEALSIPEQLSMIASRSYAHYNNFDKIVLLSCKEPAYDLRLHVWWPNQLKTAQENIHDHKWDFSSVVLKGGYYCELYEPSTHGLEMYEYRYFTRIGKDKYSMPFVRKERLNCISASKLGAGDAYTMSHHLLHRVVCNTQDVTITLLVQGRNVKDYARVFTDKPNDWLESVDSPVFSVDDISERFEILLGIL